MSREWIAICLFLFGAFCLAGTCLLQKRWEASPAFRSTVVDVWGFTLKKKSVSPAVFLMSLLTSVIIAIGTFLLAYVE